MTQPSPTACLCAWRRAGEACWPLPPCPRGGGGPVAPSRVSQPPRPALEWIGLGCSSSRAAPKAGPWHMAVGCCFPYDGQGLATKRRTSVPHHALPGRGVGGAFRAPLPPAQPVLRLSCAEGEEGAAPVPQLLLVHKRVNGAFEALCERWRGDAPRVPARIRQRLATARELAVLHNALLFPVLHRRKPLARGLSTQLACGRSASGGRSGDQEGSCVPAPRSRPAHAPGTCCMIWPNTASRQDCATGWRAHSSARSSSLGGSICTGSTPLEANSGPRDATRARTRSFARVGRLDTM